MNYTEPRNDSGKHYQIIEYPKLEDTYGAMVTAQGNLFHVHFHLAQNLFSTPT